MKQLLPTRGPQHPAYVPMQMGQPITDRNYSQMQCKANVRQQGQPLRHPQQR
ncbi:hypothetical protein N5K37_13665 [Delftia tsuruhatensis]|uniref:hypothetical protein n=1 Tax=Delftia tsuruhatensis TaxID=180282 RepID=UPI000A581ED9|nr:hypothetical protein [Delftia tsuruhatensis]MDH2230961.1 hypothetical protein [Delftia tsuruhatensis]